jgi:hypothetical protein
MQTSRLTAVKWLLVFLLAVNGVTAIAAETPPPAKIVPAKTPWARIVMVGASASAGFMLTELFGGTNTLKCRLSYYVDAALIAPHEPVRNLANALLFMMPEGAGRMQIDQALKEQPTLVLGVDFLFWFCYGPGRTDAERLQRFENGLKLLEKIPCPLVVGDIPDASYATNSGIISPDQVPTPAARAAANQRLKEWAATHPQVVIVPLADFMRTVMADRALTIHGRTLPAGKSRAILQDDQLHPNPSGAATLVLGVLDALTSQQPRFSTNDIRWNPADVFRIGYEAAKPPRPPTNQPAATTSPAK